MFYFTVHINGAQFNEPKYRGNIDFEIVNDIVTVKTSKETLTICMELFEEILCYYPSTVDLSCKNLYFEDICRNTALKMIKNTQWTIRTFKLPENTSGMWLNKNGYIVMKTKLGIRYFLEAYTDKAKVLVSIPERFINKQFSEYFYLYTQKSKIKIPFRLKSFDLLPLTENLVELEQFDFF